MNPRKDIFSVFKEGGNRMTVKPSPQAWQRLEKRMETQKKRQHGRMILIAWLTSAVVIFVLIAAYWTVSKLLPPPANPQNQPVIQTVEPLDSLPQGNSLDTIQPNTLGN
ncbi:MAG: hypothetical protein IT258_02615 [Saprospiraceae bacterium]|nr:hypothetical protein [Saprospiraceae bacterium]